MTPVPVFFCEPSGQTRRWLRRYIGSAEKCAQGEHGYHQAMLHLDDVEDADGAIYRTHHEWPHDDPRWPKACPCGRAFTDDDSWQLFTRRIYRRIDTGALMTWEDMPIGAVRHADWLLEHRASWRGEDGRILEVVIPHERGKTTWIIDSRCSNCTKPDDDQHRCWVRHGRPEDGTLHVDKQGNTCSAGGGSILVPGFHGFLHGGRLVDA